MADTQSENIGPTAFNIANFTVNMPSPIPVTDAQVTLKCTICPQSFKEKRSLMNHLAEHSKVKLFLCDLCCSAFATLHQLHVHKRELHGIDDHSLMLNFEKQKTRFQGRDKNIFTLSQQAFQNTVPAVKTLPGKRKKYACDECERRFWNMTNLRKHKRTCKKKYYECDICCKKFTFKDSLLVHRNIVHNLHEDGSPVCAGELLFKCFICKQRFLTSSELGAHDRTVHTKNKPYDCVICYQSFSNQRVLAFHIEMHTGEKPFICKKCGAIFLLPCFLEKHEAEQH